MIEKNTISPSRWIFVSIVLGAAIGMFGGYPPVFNQTVGIFMQPLTAEFHWGRADVALSYSSSMLGLAFVSPLVGNLMDKYGVRRVVLISAILFGICTAAMSLQTGGKASWIGLSFLIGVSGAATSVLGYLAILPKWFDRHLGLALAFSMFGLGLGSITMAPLTQWLISSYGWRTAYMALGFGSIVFALIAFCLLRERPALQAKRTVAGSTNLIDDLTLAEGIRSWKLWMIFGAFLMASAATLSVYPHFPPMLADKGFSNADAARAVSFLGIGLLIGRFLTGVLLDRMHAAIVVSIFFIIGAFGLLLVHSSNDYTTLMVAAVMIGLTVGAEGDLISYLIRSYFGITAFGALYGIAFAGYAIGGVVGPLAVGKLFDIYMSYDIVLVALPCMLIMAALGLLTLGKYRASAPIDVAGGVFPENA